MANQPKRRPTALVFLVAALTLLVAGAAVAYWGTTGGGSAAASTDTASPLTLGPASPAAHLVPGGQTSVVLTITNPNSASVRIGSLAPDTSQGANGFGVDGAHLGCVLSALSFATQTNAGAGWIVPGSAALSVTLTNALSMATSAADACQGAAFTVYLTVAS
jgi:hypothetical protein